MNDDEYKRDDSGRFGKGNPGGPGRPKGSPNQYAKKMADRSWMRWLVRRSKPQRMATSGSGRN